MKMFGFYYPIVSIALVSCLADPGGLAIASLGQKAAAAQEATGKNTAAAQEATGKKTAEEQEAEHELPQLDILIVADIPHFQLKTELYRSRDKAHADAIIGGLQDLPATLAGSDYQIALLGHTCIESIITKNSQPSPGEALLTSIAAISSTEATEVIGPGEGLAGGVGPYYALDNVITGLTDIHSSALPHTSMPTTMGRTQNATQQDIEYVDLGDGLVGVKFHDNSPVTMPWHYRQLDNGLTVVDYYDNEGHFKCNRPWLRAGSAVVIILVEVLPSNHKGFSLCNNSYLCTMPDLEETLRDLERLAGSGASIKRNYRLYAFTSKLGYLYNNPSPIRAERAAVAEIIATMQPPGEYNSEQHEEFGQKTDVVVDWDDFENYFIKGSNQHLVDHLGAVDKSEDYELMLDDIAKLITE